MTESELQAIQGRADKATRGPWKIYERQTLLGLVNERAIGTEWDHPQLQGPAPVVTTSTTVEGTGVWINDSDAEFIAHARIDIPLLLEEVARLRDQQHYSSIGKQELLDAIEAPKADLLIALSDARSKAERCFQEKEEMREDMQVLETELEARHHELDRLRQALQTGKEPTA